MKKRNLIFGILLSTMIVLGGCGGKDEAESTVPPSKETEYASKESVSAQGADHIETARSYLLAWQEGNYEKMAQDFSFDSAMKEIVSSGKMESSLKQLSDTLGKLEKIEEPFVAQRDKGMTVSVPCKFANQEINININFNAQAEIAGIVTAKYQQGTTPLPEGVKEEEISLEIGKEKNFQAH